MAKRSVSKKKDIPHESCAFFSKWFRSQMDLSQRELAALIGVHWSTVGSLESDTRTLPTEIMYKIYQKCNVDQRKFLLECLHKDLERLFFGN